MKLKEDTRIVRRPDKVLVYSSTEGDIFETNEIGGFIVERLMEGLEEKDIVTALVQATNGDEDRIAGDLKEFLAQLKEEGLLQDE